MDLKGILIPIAATPTLQALLNIAGQLKLPPMGHWGWNSDIVTPVTFVVSTGFAAVGCLAAPRTRLKRIIAIVAGVIALLACLWGYTWASTNPPPAKMSLLLYDIVSYITFFGTYAAFGYSVAGLVGFFSAPRKPAKSPKAQPTQ